MSSQYGMKLLLTIFFVFIYLPNIHMKNSPFEQYKWKNRLLVIYASESDDPDFERQLNNFAKHRTGYEERDLLVLHLSDNFVKSQPNGNLLTVNVSQAHNFLSITKEDGFKVFLIGKDGSIKKHQTTPMSNQNLFATIDAMPMRQRERIKDGR